MKPIFKNLLNRISKFLFIGTIFTLATTIASVILVAIILVIGYPVTKYSDYKEMVKGRQDSIRWSTYSNSPEYKKDMFLYHKWLSRKV